MKPQDANGRAGKTWPGSLRSDFSLVWGIPGPQRCPEVHPGAVRERFGELSELRNRLSGSFRRSEIDSQSPLSDHFGGMFDFKVGRWHCGAHAMAENTESHEVCSTLSGNAVNVNIFSRVDACGLWPGNRPEDSSSTIANQEAPSSLRSQDPLRGEPETLHHY